MFIEELKIHNFRNIEDKHFSFKNKINVFYGKNGVGKTSILESIHYLSTGKSFRKGKANNLINFTKNDLTVFINAKTQENHYTFAVNKNKNNQWHGKINGNKTSKQSQINTLIPVVSIDPEVYRLVDFGPIYRRNFLDWMVFHVKHNYLNLWKNTYKCIKQLNFLYKNKATNEEITPWENNFIHFSNELNEIRQETFNFLLPEIMKASRFMQNEIEDISLSYKKGWTLNSFKEQIDFDRSKNRLYGQLQHGPHKMDIKISVGNQQASQILSRGQKKILSITFYMAYIKYLTKRGISPILCLDDFDAELDDEKLKKAAFFFRETNSQIFVTTVQKNKIKKVFKKADLFHVKQTKV